ncbi:MAG: mechanosensitive ion channel [Anaeromyxobacter sp.]|nr:mechanosensitive ion channel [Anaeromyxobacter sp.]MBL0276554.1 mechanosensitive ion channel [Anaeromyxobacter sp.]
MRPTNRFLSSIALAALLLVGGAAAAAPTSEPGAWLRLRDQRILELRSARGELPAGQRARDATRALEAAVAASPGAAATLEVGPDGALLRVGDTTVLQLGPEDAAAEAMGLSELAGRSLASLRAALEAERRRQAAHDVIYKLSMLVFSGLVALLLARSIGRAAVAAAGRLEAAETHVPALAVAGVELASGPAVRGAAAVALRLGRFVAQAGVAVAWGLSALSHFELTRGSRDRIAAALAEPLVSLGGGLAGAVPLLVVGAVGVVLVALLVRGAEVFFDAVARGDATLRWLPRDLAPAVGRLVRVAIVLLALLLGASAAGADGLLGGLARAALLALGLAAAPLAASALAGLPLVLGRTLRPGDLVELGGHRGRVVGLGLLATVLEEAGGARVRVPHLLSLVRPVRVEDRAPEGRP